MHQHCGSWRRATSTAHGGFPMISATRVALEVPSLVPTEAAVGIVSHLLHTGLDDRRELAARYGGRDQRLTQWPGSRTTDLVLRLADARFESIGEARTFYWCWRLHLPAPVPQHPVLDASGRVVAVVDFAWPELGVFLEFDGKVKYEKLLQRRRAGQRRRDPGEGAGVAHLPAHRVALPPHHVAGPRGPRADGRPDPFRPLPRPLRPEPPSPMHCSGSSAATSGRNFPREVPTSPVNRGRRAASGGQGDDAELGGAGEEGVGGDDAHGVAEGAAAGELDGAVEAGAAAVVGLGEGQRGGRRCR